MKCSNSLAVKIWQREIRERFIKTVLQHLLVAFKLSTNNVINKCQNTSLSGNKSKISVLRRRRENSYVHALQKL